MPKSALLKRPKLSKKKMKKVWMKMMPWIWPMKVRKKSPLSRKIWISSQISVASPALNSLLR